jgi:HAD superfamily hydrolase (TIGR01509 family)
MALPELVIFDCDGTLVDSERLAVEVDARMLADLGWPLERHEIIERFVGGTGVEMRAAIEQAIGRRLPDDWHAPYTPWFHEAYRRELAIVEGVDDLLEALEVPTCIGSNTTRSGIRMRLELTGLDAHFDDARIFCAEDVARGKPAPDLFLHAADQLGAEPERCVVIEDSPAGVRAANAAGMRVLTFAGTIVPHHRFPEGTTFFGHMREVPALLGLT